MVSLGTGSAPVKKVSILDIYRPDSLVAVAKMAFYVPALGELLIDQVRFKILNKNVPNSKNF